VAIKALAAVMYAGKPDFKPTAVGGMNRSLGWSGRWNAASCRRKWARQFEWRGLTL